MALVQIPPTAGFTGLNVGSSFIATSQGTTSSSLVDLATVQSVTLTTGTKVLVLMSATASINTGGGNLVAKFGVGVSGATTRTADAEDGTFGLGTFTSGNPSRYTSFVYLTCTPGSNTFTMKYAVGQFGVTSTYSNRYLTVIDLGS
jgi:hypothetical protein